MTSAMSFRVAARYQMATEFPSDKALKEYLREHPQADRSKHTVSDGKEEAQPEKKSLKERLTQALKSVPEKAKRFVARIFEAYRANPDQLPPKYLARAREEGREQSITDYVAGMTDRFAQDEYQRLYEPFERV